MKRFRRALLVTAMLLAAALSGSAVAVGAVDGRRLAIGITEPQPNLLWPAAAKPLAPPFDVWRNHTGAIRPAYYRLQLDWFRLQPDPDGPFAFDEPNAGCLRERLPCAPFSGLREQLQALAARQAEGGWEAVVAISGTPEWAASPPGGCERSDIGFRSRPPRPETLAQYIRLVTEILALAAEVGAELRWWNAWNEPNHPYFVSPQRAACDVASPTLGPAVYAGLHAALGEALDAAPGAQERIIGDLAGAPRPSITGTGVGEFIAALPEDVVCGTRIWAQHAYLSPRDDARVAGDALAARRCPFTHEIWVTETGARNTAEDPPPLRRCQSMHRRLQTWYRDPQVTAAMQYTVREDDRFPYGLIGTDLEAAFPVLGLWQAWGGGSRPHPGDRAPALARACRETP